jgi:hypothetical protein
MDQPIDYTIKTVDPTELFTKTLGMYQGIEQNQQALEANKLNLEAARQKIEAERAGQEQQAKIQAGLARLSSPDVTAQDYANISMLLPKDQAEAVRAAYEMRDEATNKAALRKTAEIFTAFKSGKPNVGVNLLSNEITALRNSGKEQEAAKLETWLEIAKDDPKAVEDFFGYTMAAMPGGKEVLTSAIDYAKSKPEIATLEAKSKSAVSQAIIDEVGAENAPAMAKLERQSKAVGIQLDQARIKEIGNSIKVANENLKIAREAATGLGVKLPVATQALVNKVATDSVVNQQAGLNYIDFANRVAGSNVRGGFMGTADKFIQGMGGDPNLIRLEATKLINSDAMAGLPAGSASDKDVAMVREGYPDNVNSKTLTQFFRGTAKVKLIQAQTQSNTAEWLTMNGTLGPARAPMTVGGRAVKPGETFTKFNGSAAAEIIRNVDRQVAQTAVKPPVKPQGRAASGGKIPGVTVSNF